MSNSEEFDELPFSPNGFKNWMSGQIDKPNKGRRHELIGQQVESKISIKRLVTKITSDEGDIKELSEDFYQYGGIVLEMNKNYATVEVDSGTFTIHKLFLKKAD